MKWLNGDHLGFYAVFQFKEHCENTYYATDYKFHFKSASWSHAGKHGDFGGLLIK